MNKQLVNDILQWDVKSWSKALAYWETNVNWESVENGLELGGREGGLSLWLALQGKKVMCSDYLDVKYTATKLHKKYKVEEFVEYRDIDATDIPYENEFDLIVFKSIIGGIGRHDDIEKQQKVFEQIHKALKPGGRLLFAENLTASTLHQKLRKKFLKWGSSWRYVSIPEMNEFLKDFSTYEIKATGVLATFGRNESQRRFLAVGDHWLLNKICPSNWKYICYGQAVK